MIQKVPLLSHPAPHTTHPSTHPTFPRKSRQLNFWLSQLLQLWQAKSMLRGGDFFPGLTKHVSALNARMFPDYVYESEAVFLIQGFW